MFGEHYAEKDYGYFGGDEWKRLDFICTECGGEWSSETEDIEKKEFCSVCEAGPFPCSDFEFLKDDPR